jgi:hypothetical protein
MKGSQRALYCACGRDSILAHGLCPTRYTLKRRDASYFGGLREEVLKETGIAVEAVVLPADSSARLQCITVNRACLYFLS